MSLLITVTYSTRRCLYRFFGLDWSFCVLERRSHPDYTAVKRKRDKPEKAQHRKYNEELIKRNKKLVSKPLVYMEKA